LGLLKSYTGRERAALQSLTGLTQERRNGLAVIQAVLLRRRLGQKESGASGSRQAEARFAAFVCPFGPAPGRVLVHDWPADRGEGEMVVRSHCGMPGGPVRYVLNVIDLGLRARPFRPTAPKRQVPLIDEPYPGCERLGSIVDRVIQRIPRRGDREPG
jgi:hypothetical protein